MSFCIVVQSPLCCLKTQHVHSTIHTLRLHNKKHIFVLRWPNTANIFDLFVKRAHLFSNLCVCFQNLSKPAVEGIVQVRFPQGADAQSVSHLAFRRLAVQRLQELLLLAAATLSPTARPHARLACSLEFSFSFRTQLLFQLQSSR